MITHQELIDILGLKLIETKYFFFDLWSILHIAWGIILAFLIPNIWLGLGIVVGYEIVEIVLFKIGIFNVEVLLDTIWDIIITFGAYVIARFIIFKRVL